MTNLSDAVATADLLYGYSPDDPSGGLYLTVRAVSDWPADGPRVVAVALDPARTSEGLDAIRRLALGLPAAPTPVAAVSARTSDDGLAEEVDEDR